MSDNVNMSNRAVGPHYSVFLVIDFPFPHRFVVFISRPLAVLWMDPLGDSLPAWGWFLGIATPNSVSFWRPVVNFTGCRIVGRATRMTEPLRFSQISFATLNNFFRNFALFVFYTRAIPFDDLSRFVALWLFTMKEPTIFPISPAHARLND